MLKRNVNVGCGFDKRDGYVNVDLHAVHAPDVVADITDIRGLPDGAFEEVMANDVLEHVPRAKVLPALVEWNRLLVREGLLRLRVPDLESIARLLLMKEYQSGAMTMLFGTQSYAGDFHLSGFTNDTLAAQLVEAGFAPCSMSLQDGWLLVAEARKAHDVRSTAFDLAKDDAVSQGDFVDGVYSAVLGREADAVGRDHFLDSLNTGLRDRWQVIATLAGTAEAKSRGVPLVERMV